MRAAVARLSPVCALLTLALAVGPVPADARSAAPEPATGPSEILGWGANHAGALDPPASLDADEVVELAAGDDHALALTRDGRVTAWGWNRSGQTDVPASLQDKRVIDIDAGVEHSLALTSDGRVTAWGSNRWGQVDVPQSLEGKQVTAIAAAQSGSLALTSDGQLTAWGENYQGFTQIPQRVSDEVTVAADTGGDYGVAIDDRGTVRTWGKANSVGEVPRELSGWEATETATAVAAGFSHAHALTPEGRVISWGGNAYGEVDTMPASHAGRRVTDIAAGVYHSLARFEDGTVVAWGRAFKRSTRTPMCLDGRDVTEMAVGSAYNLVLAGPAPKAPRGVKPVVDLRPTPRTVERGQTTTLLWDSTHATSLAAGGAWAGRRKGCGTAEFSSDRLGKFTYSLRARNASGTTTRTVSVEVVRPGKLLGVTVSPAARRPARDVRVAIRGLERGERFTISSPARKVLLRGKAGNPAAGPTVRTVALPGRGTRVVRVEGSTERRKGSATFTRR